MCFSEVESPSKAGGWMLRTSLSICVMYSSVVEQVKFV